MKKTTLQEVKDKFFISMTSKEKFDYDSQRIQNNCNKVQCMLQGVEPIILMEQAAPFLSLITHIQQELGRMMGMPKEHVEHNN